MCTNIVILRVLKLVVTYDFHETALTFAPCILTCTLCLW